MLNIEKYKNEIKEDMINRLTRNALSISFFCGFDDIYKKYNKVEGATSTIDIIDWLCEECKEQYLTPDEQDYLYCFLQPYFDEYDLTIEKVFNDWEKENEFIRIYFDSKVNPEQDSEVIFLPNFKAGTRYQGLENDKEYSLEELGIK